MTSLFRTSLAVSVALTGLGMAAVPTVAVAQPSQQGCTTAPGLNYMICNGRRAPKPGNRVTNSDGSWREESRQGNCVVVREKTATGEYKESRRCD